MTDERFVRLSDREEGTLPEPVEGIPPWLAYSLWQWCESSFKGWRQGSYGGGSTYHKEENLSKVEVDLRLQLSGDSGLKRLQALERYILADEQGFLDLVDLVLQGRFSDISQRRVETLDRLLHDAGSVWTVAKVGDSFALERRVTRGVREAVEQAVALGGKAGAYLAASWRTVYGRDPDPSAAYNRAVRAVEAAAKPAVTATNPKATLGTMIKALTDKPSKWEASLNPTAADGIDPVLVVRDMMKLIWNAQVDRHGDPDEDVALDVSAEEAEAALHVAAALVHLFASDALRATRPS